MSGLCDVLWGWEAQGALAAQEKTVLGLRVPWRRVSGRLVRQPASKHWATEYLWVRNLKVASNKVALGKGLLVGVPVKPALGNWDEPQLSFGCGEQVLQPQGLLTHSCYSFHLLKNWTSHPPHLNFMPPFR